MPFHYLLNRHNDLLKQEAFALENMQKAARLNVDYLKQVWDSHRAKKAYLPS